MCMITVQPHLGADTVPACDHVRLLGVIISAALSLYRHVSVISSASFCWLRQLRQVRRSIDDESAAILVHAFVMSSVDCCKLLLAVCCLLPTSCSGSWTLQYQRSACDKQYLPERRSGSKMFAGTALRCVPAPLHPCFLVLMLWCNLCGQVMWTELVLVIAVLAEHSCSVIV